MFAHVLTRTIRRHFLSQEKKKFSEDLMGKSDEGEVQGEKVVSGGFFCACNAIKKKFLPC